MHTSPLGYFTCFLVRVFPVLSLMYLAINSFLPETKKKCIMKDKNIISTNTIKIPHLSMSSMRMRLCFLTSILLFLCELFTSISHFSSVFLFPLLNRHCMCHTTEACGFRVFPQKSCRYLQAEKHLLSQWWFPSCLVGETSVLGVDTRSGLLWFCFQLCWVEFAPPNHQDPAARSSCSQECGVSPEHKSQSPRFYSFTPAFLQVLILWEGRQNLSLLPRSTLPAPLTETTVPVQQVINHTLNSTHKSRHPAVTEFLLQWGQSTRWFVI